MRNIIISLIGLNVILTFVNCQQGNNNNNNNLVHGEFVGFGEFNPNQPNFPVGQGTTNARPGGSVVFNRRQRPPPPYDNLNNGNNNGNDNGLIRGRFPGFISSTNQVLATTVPTPSVQSTTVSNTTYMTCLASCPSTTEYNPVCGNDNQTYTNEGRLSCAQRCGRSVAMTRRGTCRPM